MERIIAFDILKGLAMYLVILTHFLQYVVGHTFDNTLFLIVYVFHMPLFMIISGYLFRNKIGSPLQGLMLNQFRHLVLPMLITGAVIHLLSAGYIDIRYILNLPKDLWFLTSLFVCSVAYAVAYKITKRIVLTTVILSLAVLCIPSGFYYIKFFMPFFGVGLILSDKKFLHEVKAPTAKWLILAFVGLIALYILIWEPTYYVYITPPPFILSGDIEKWVAHIMRLIFGTLITLYLMLLFKGRNKSEAATKFVVKCSYNSLYLYIFHYVLLTSIGHKIAINLDSELLADAVSIICTLIFTFLMNVAIDFMRRNKYTKSLVLADFKD